jgi:hypothetical protein
MITQALTTIHTMLAVTILDHSSKPSTTMRALLTDLAGAGELLQLLAAHATNEIVWYA